MSEMGPEIVVCVVELARKKASKKTLHELEFYLRMILREFIVVLFRFKLVL